MVMLVLHDMLMMLLNISQIPIMSGFENYFLQIIFSTRNFAATKSTPFISVFETTQDQRHDHSQSWCFNLCGATITTKWDN